MRLLKNKNKKNRINNLSFGKLMHKTNSQILSISSTNREKEKDNFNKNKEKNKNINVKTISLNDGININNYKKLNKNILNKYKNKLKNESLKNIISIKKIKSNKKIFDKKIITNKNVDMKNNKKNYKSNIPISNRKFNYETYQKKEKDKSLQNKTEIYKNIVNLFKNNKKNIFFYKKRYPSNSYKLNNDIKHNKNNSTYNLDKDRLTGNKSQRIKNQKTFFSDL